MESTFNVSRSRFQVSTWLWRLAVILLPWQIRWFSSSQNIGGYPWEQGRLSVYLSWLPMLAMTALAFFIPSEVGTQSDRVDSCGSTELTEVLHRKDKKLIGLGLVFLIFVSLFTFSPRATIEWWVEVALLVAFVWALIRLRVDRQRFATWFVISLVPHALLGFYQFVTQTVAGSKWLGMATQISSMPGVSVVMHEGARILRAYGGFPHPNIFGGWLAVGIVVAIWLITIPSSRLHQISAGHLPFVRRGRLAFAIIVALFSLLLVLTFSRGAWIALAVGLITLLFTKYETSDTKIRSKTIAVVLLAFVVTAFPVRQLIFTRTDIHGSLERKSVSERIIGLQNGWALFKEHPFVGVGPGATALARNSQIIPHFVPLLMLDEIGLIGVIGFIFVCLPLAKGKRPDEYRGEGVLLALIFSLVILSLFDHFLWSLWSGRALAAIILAFVLLP